MRKILIICVAAALAAVALMTYGGRFPAGMAETEGHGSVNFADRTILNPVAIGDDPYMGGVKPPDDHTMKTAVCGIRFADTGRKKYHIRTFSGEADAARSGYTVTHRGYCGTCSTLRDLAVYLKRRDMTYAVRSCSFRITRSGILSCLESIGFTEPCALTWYYNIRNTTRHCLGTCLLSWMKREPLNRADGTLNDCIRCDEEMSGPIFKYYAGRTRRNSGIESEIARDPKELYRIVHDYR